MEVLLGACDTEDLEGLLMSFVQVRVLVLLAVEFNVSESTISIR